MLTVAKDGAAVLGYPDRRFVDGHRRGVGDVQAAAGAVAHGQPQLLGANVFANCLYLSLIHI